MSTLPAEFTADVGAERLTRVRAALPPEIPDAWHDLAAAAALQMSPGQTVGIAGGQGAGKSTLARAICAARDHITGTADCLALSIDDFYLTRAERLSLADSVHALCATRGVPGTHDVALAGDTLAALAGGGAASVPVFDKGLDDRLPRSDWIHTAGVINTVFEGWCLGVVPQPEPALLAAINELERLEDPDGVWRRWSNRAVNDYQGLWKRVDFWIYLEVPDIAAVTRWRGEQEQSLPVAQRMTGAEIERFVAHYQRITEWMQSTPLSVLTGTYASAKITGFVTHL